MAEKRIKAIVLKSVEYQDFDRIVTIYSDKYGKIALMALGVNKPKSKNAYSLTTFAFCEFEIFKSRALNSLSKLKTGYLLNSNIVIAQNYNNYLFASVITSIVLQDQHFVGKNYRLFKILTTSITNIAKNKNPFSTLVRFMFYTLKFFGVQWNLNKCYKCNQKQRIYRKFDFQHYGLVCAFCFSVNDGPQQTNMFIEYLMHLSKQSSDDIFDATINVAFEIIISKLLFVYYTQEIGVISRAINELLAKPIYEDLAFDRYTNNVLTK